jgi:hypothetical protein
MGGNVRKKTMGGNTRKKNNKNKNEAAAKMVGADEKDEELDNKFKEFFEMFVAEKEKIVEMRRNAFEQLEKGGNELLKAAEENTEPAALLAAISGSLG